MSQLLCQLRNSNYFIAIDFLNNILFFHSGFVSSSSFNNFADINAGRFLQSHLFCFCRSQFPHSYPQYSFLHFTKFFQITNYFTCHIHRNGKRITGITTCRRLNRSINTDQFTFRINQSPATVPGIYSSIGLQKRLQTHPTSQSSGFCTDNTGSNCRSQVVRITNCQNPLTQHNIIRISIINRL